MRCQFDVFMHVLQQIEEHKPSLFIDDLRIESRNVQRYRRGQEQAEEESLEIRFILYAYMKKLVETGDEE